MAAMVFTLGKSLRDILVERPISRLSKRITKNPASIRRLIKLSGQKISCDPKPMTNNNGGLLGLPPTSTQSSISSETGIMACCIKSEIGDGYQSCRDRAGFCIIVLTPFDSQFLTAIATHTGNLTNSDNTLLEVDTGERLH